RSSRGMLAHSSARGPAGAAIPGSPVLGYWPPTASPCAADNGPCDPKGGCPKMRSSMLFHPRGSGLVHRLPLFTSGLRVAADIWLSARIRRALRYWLRSVCTVQARGRDIHCSGLTGSFCELRCGCALPLLFYPRIDMRASEANPAFEPVRVGKVIAAAVLVVQGLDGLAGDLGEIGKAHPIVVGGSNFGHDWSSSGAHCLSVVLEPREPGWAGFGDPPRVSRTKKRG